MGWWAVAAILAGFWALAQLNLDCMHESRSKAELGRVRLAEIEAVEDIHQAALRDALGRCPSGAAREPCRSEVERRFDAAWQKQKAEIEEKYRRMLEEFQVRCRASLT